MSRQRLLADRLSEATGTSLCIDYDTICPAAENNFSLRYDLSCYWQQFLLPDDLF